MTQANETTAVVIVGGIRCTILEEHSREHVENRQRAGALDAHGVRMLRRRGVEEVVEAVSGGSGAPEVPLLVDGEERLRETGDDDPDAAFCPQQVLVRNLIKVFRRDGGDLRLEAADVSIMDIDTERPSVRYRDPDGSVTVLGCADVAGSDGYHGVSRPTIPADVLECHTHEFGYAWLSDLAEVPAVLAVHSRGFAAQITRGSAASRLYLQCPVTDTVGEWPDERIRAQLEARFGRPPAVTGPIASKQVVPLRGVVFSPMSHGRLHLAGDAAHLISPMSAEGMSLALHDADVLARDRRVRGQG